MKKNPMEVNKYTFLFNNYRLIDYVCFFLYFINRNLMQDPELLNFDIRGDLQLHPDLH